MKPRILLAATSRWPVAARLAAAFAEAGSAVEIVCPPGHPAATLRIGPKSHVFQRRAPLASLRSALQAAEPDLIIPCDEAATRHLHRFHARLLRLGSAATWMLEVLNRSLGPAASQTVIDSRSRLLEMAREEAIAVPETLAVVSVSELRAWLARHGFPALLKADETSGGEGVRIIHGTEGADPAFAALRGRPGRGRESGSFPRSKPGLQVQQFIEGRDATTSVACWQGRVVASIHGEVLKTMYARGPASVLRLIDHPEMDQCAERLVRRLGLSGIFGFDFRLEADTGKARLIEMNARATQISHLAPGEGSNLPAALQAAMSGAPAAPAKQLSGKNIIVLFPQEWSRDPGSEFLASGFHDVPWQEPGLVKYCVENHPPSSQNRRVAEAKSLLQMVRRKIHGNG
jgi:glutathione synthase/RimK-type ligase-like ATP-grasp enzyme